MLRPIALTAAIFLLPTIALADDSAGWWWPELPVPAAVVRTTPVETFAPTRPGERGADAGPTQMLVQSAAGLAAAAVKRGDHDEMVWVNEDNPNHLLAWQYLNKRLKLEDRGELKPWELVRRLKDAGIIKGYILYDYPRRGRRRGEPDNLGSANSESANVATSVAGILGGVIVDARLEGQAKELGLTMLLDARDKDSAWLWENYRDKFNRRAAMFQDPRKPHARDFAIAHDIIVLYGNGELERKVLGWLEPLSPILGWNGGDEGQNAKLFSQYGHFNTATDWAMNLPLLSAGARDAKPGMLPKPRTVTLDADRPVVSFVMSDGDNLQWMVQNFFRDKQRRYWSNPANGDFPFTWTLCLAHMRQVTPDLLKYTIDTLPAATSAVEFGGGYYFPDRFGELRDEPDLLARHARKTWANMQAVGSDVLCLIFDDLDSDAAKRAMQTYADEMPGLRGILAMQYSPYSEGAGEIYWFDREDGPPLPVATCRLELRTDFKIDTTGGVDFIAQTLNNDPLPAQWVVQHAWSSFEVPAGTAIPTTERNNNSGRVTGLHGSMWTIDKLKDALQVVTVQQMFEQVEPPGDE